MTITLKLMTETVERLKEESRRRDPNNSREPIGPVIDALVEEYLDPTKKPSRRKGGEKLN